MKTYENLNHTQNCMPVGRVLLVSLSLLYVAMCACFLLLLGKKFSTILYPSKYSFLTFLEHIFTPPVASCFATAISFFFFLFFL